MSDDEKQDDASKTEDASQKKLEDAREKGQVAQSKDLSTWVMFLAATILIGTAMPSMFANFTDYLKSFLENSHAMPQGAGGVGVILTDILLNTFGISLLFFLVLFVAAIFGPTMQIGFLIAPKLITPDLSKISIIKGFGRIFSIRSIVEFIKGILKMVAVGAVGFILIIPYFSSVEHTINQSPVEMLVEGKDLSIKMLIGILVVFLAIALADFLYQRWEFMKQMRMTKQEVKDEYKQTEGDPFIKGKLKQMRMEKARQRMMQNVPKATVVITNPTHYAIALKYEPDEAEAPVVIAKGIDNVALRIREVATEHDIILFENKPLARTLYDTVEIDEAIPEELYKAVAEIISYVFKKKGKIK